MSILNLEGAYENDLTTAGEFNPQAPKTALMLPTGQRVVLPTEVLLAAMGVTSARQDPDGTVALAEPPATDVQDVEAPATVPDGTDAGHVIPLVAEEMLVGKTLVETGRVRVRRETEEHVQTVSVPLAEVRWEVERVPVERLVDAQPEIRQVGETFIFPLAEERLVVKREIWLREEVHLRKVTSVVEKTADFPVKRDVLIEERT